MAKENKAEKKAAKAEKKANRNPEIIKSVISAVTSVACVAAIVATSLSITDKICDTNKSIAETSAKNPASSIVSTDIGGTEDPGVVDPATEEPAAEDPATEEPAAEDPATEEPAAAETPSDTKADSKPAASTDSAPVGSDVAKIVAYYNTVANNTKAYKGKMVIKGKQGASTKITDTSFPKAAMDIANGMLPNDYDGDSRNYTVTNGQAADGKSIQKILPIDGDAKMSKLPASGVQSAKCTKSGSGYKIELKLKPEKTNSFSVQPPNHKVCMDCLNMTDEDLKPFTCENCVIGYNGGTITATVNDKGLITEFHVYNPMHITGTLKWTVISGTAVIDANWKQDLTIAY